jgi:putative restriction endonuclease
VSLNLERELRLAAFVSLRAILDKSGGVITREAMNTGFEFRGERIQFASERQGIWRPRQLGKDGAALSLVTVAVRKGVVPRYDDQVGSDAGYFEYRYQGRDPGTWTNVAVRKAAALRLPLIYFYGVTPGLFEAFMPVYVSEDEPERLTFHLSVDAPGIGTGTLFTGGSEAPLKQYATVAAKRRIHQRRFRELVVAAYAGRCTICRLQRAELLDAAHILEDHDARGQPEVPNGLALCRIHHAAYDADILGISPDYLVHIRRDVLAEKDGPMLLHGLQEMDRARIGLPRVEGQRPRKDYLAERYSRFLAA